MGKPIELNGVCSHGADDWGVRRSKSSGIQDVRRDQSSKGNLKHHLKIAKSWMPCKKLGQVLSFFCYQLTSYNIPPFITHKKKHYIITPPPVVLSPRKFIAYYAYYPNQPVSRKIFIWFLAHLVSPVAFVGFFL